MTIKECCRFKTETIGVFLGSLCIGSSSMQIIKLLSACLSDYNPFQFKENAYSMRILNAIIILAIIINLIQIATSLCLIHGVKIVRYYYINIIMCLLIYI